MDALLLSRMQFAWVIAWHILLPAFTVGLSCYIATLETLWWLKKDDVYRRLSAFWIRIFAVSFGMGVVSGIVMPFQFGTNWSRYIDATANVVGGLMAYEVLTAFFLEAAFLGVLLFGRKLVPQWAHVFSAVMVALGASFDDAIASILAELKPNLPPALRSLSDSRLLVMVNWSIMAAWHKTIEQVGHGQSRRGGQPHAR